MQEHGQGTAPQKEKVKIKRCAKKEIIIPITAFHIKKTFLQQQTSLHICACVYISIHHTYSEAVAMTLKMTKI